MDPNILSRKELNNAEIKSLLENTHNDALRKNQELAWHFIRVRDEHTALLTHLQTLPNRISYDIMVPVGSKALMRGRMVHTNEILVSLGQDYFVKCSANHSKEICNRRIQMCTEMLEKLKKEEEFLTSRKELPFKEDAFGTNECVEIIEPYDEEKEAEWRISHRQKEREYRQKLAELRKAGKIAVNTEENLDERLRNYEMMEELEDELNRLQVDSEEQSVDNEEDDDSADDDDDDDSEIDESDLIQTLLPNDKLGKGNGLSLGIRDPSPVRTSDGSQNIEASPENVKARRVSFADEKPPVCSANIEDEKKDIVSNSLETETDTDEDVPTISFKHSSISETIVSNDNYISEESYIFQTPADIYRTYKEQIHRKSILKNKFTEEEIQKRMSWLEQTESVRIVNEDENYDDNDMCIKPPPPVVDEVIEHNIVSQEKHQPLTKPQSQSKQVSKFKASRLAAKH